MNQEEINKLEKRISNIEKVVEAIINGHINIVKKQRG